LPPVQRDFDPIIDHGHESLDAGKDGQKGGAGRVEAVAPVLR